MIGAQRAAGGTWREAEFNALFRSHYAPVYRHLFRIVGAREEAEDLAQETFVRLYRHSFPSGRQHNVRGWLYKVATNLAYNALRGERRRESRHSVAQAREGASREMDETKADPMEAAIRADERETVRRALAMIPDRQAKLLMLRHGGLSYREVASILGVSAGSVGTLLIRAERAFARAYRELVPVSDRGESDEV